jgi:S-DNA-T family DNA segregation ATPase FtsK/SpoIIIE
MKQAYRFKTLKAHQGRAIATLGLDDEGAPLHIRLPSPDVAHILVSGMTGSGKTVLMRSIILSLAITESPDDLRLVLIDPKGSAFPIFNSLPHTMLDVHTTTQQAAKSINTLVGIMEGRGEIQVNDTRAVLVIDELADLLMTHPEAQEPLTRLLQRGRGSGIHVVAATQKPTASVLGSLMTANFPVRLVGKVSSANDARVASGWSGTGAERLEGRGDFIAVAEGKLIRFQAAYITDDEITDAIYQINRGAPILPSGNQSHSLNLTRAL